MILTYIDMQIKYIKVQFRTSYNLLSLRFQTKSDTNEVMLESALSIILHFAPLYVIYSMIQAIISINLYFVCLIIMAFSASYSLSNLFLL